MAAYQDRVPKKPSEAAEFFFDLANESRVVYRCATSPPKTITVQQNKDIEDSTGGIVWETSFLLATYLERRSLCAPRSAVLEVGAGCGMLGLVLAAHGCRVVVSEASEAMANLTRNVAAVKAQQGSALRVEARLLRWDVASDVESAAASAEAPFDLVVGTDVFFSPELVEPLLQTIAAVCHRDTVVFLCFQVIEFADH